MKLKRVKMNDKSIKNEILYSNEITSIMRPFSCNFIVLGSSGNR